MSYHCSIINATLFSNVVTYQTPGVSDILLSLTRQDVGAVVTTLMMMDNAPSENISSIWSGNAGLSLVNIVNTRLSLVNIVITRLSLVNTLYTLFSLVRAGGGPGGVRAAAADPPRVNHL